MRSSDLRYGFLPTYTSTLCSSTGSSRTASKYQRPSATISWSQQSGNALLLWLCLRLRIGHLLSPQTSALSNLVSHQTRSLMHQPAQPPVETKISAKKRHTRREYRISKHYLRRRHQHCNEFCQLQTLNPWIKPQSLRSHLRKPASNRQMPVSCTKATHMKPGLMKIFTRRALKVTAFSQ